MRIAFISHEYPPDTGKGGIGTYVNQIAKALSICEHDVHVFAGSTTRTISENNDGYWVHRIQCENGNDFRTKVVSVFAIFEKKLNFDFIESPEINANAWEIKKAYPHIPLVVRLHAPNWLVEHTKKRYVSFQAKLRYVFGAFRRFRLDFGYWRPYDKNTDLDYQFSKAANFITAPSDIMRQWVVNKWRINPAKIQVIPNLFMPSEKLLSIPIDKENNFKRIIFFGRLNVLKGLVNASKAMKRILREFPSWQFRVIGDDGNGPHAGTMMKEWMENELKSVISRVEFVDGLPYQSIPTAIAEGEIVLLPSLFESFSYTCIEAMAAGKAVVGSKNSGMKDLLQSDKSGILIDPEKHWDIYRAVKKLIQDTEFRYRISVNARERVQTEFNSAKTVEKFTTYYRQITKVSI